MNTTQFSERLKCLLSENKCSQKVLAEKIGVKPNTVSDWINHGTSPRVNVVYAMAQYFNISFDYLFTGKHDAYDPRVQLLSDDELELITYFRKLPEREQHVQIGIMLNESKRFENSEKEPEETVENEKNAV